MLYLSDGYFDVDLKVQPVVWTHVVLNYMSLETREGIKTYENGGFTAADTIKRGPGYFTADGRVVIGRTQTANDGGYASVKLDELMLFNEALSEEQIKDLSAQA